MGRGPELGPSGHPGVLHGSECSTPSAAHYAEGREELHVLNRVGTRVGKCIEKQRQAIIFGPCRQDKFMIHARIESFEARACTIPADRPEADGTASQTSATIAVVEVKHQD